MSARIDAELSKLAAFLQNSPSGVTYAAIQLHLGCSRYIAQIRIRQLRLIYATSPTNSVATETQGYRKQWIHKLVTHPDDAKWWTANRLNDVETRLTTIKSVGQSMLNATDARTIIGRKARKIVRTLEYLEQELAEIAS